MTSVSREYICTNLGQQSSPPKIMQMALAPRKRGGPHLPPRRPAPSSIVLTAAAPCICLLNIAGAMHHILRALFKTICECDINLSPPSMLTHFPNRAVSGLSFDGRTSIHLHLFYRGGNQSQLLKVARHSISYPPPHPHTPTPLPHPPTYLVKIFAQTYLQLHSHTRTHTHKR